MPAVQMRMPMSRDFEDITLYGPNEIHEKDWNRQRNSQGSEDASFSSHIDPHYSMASTSSVVSTPTLISDASSFRSSISSHSSPSLPQFTASGMPPMAPPNGLKIRTQDQTILDPQGKPIPNNLSSTQLSNYGRRGSVPALVDTTSMASLTIKAQSGTRSRKQRELDFEADQDDDIWPGDSLMFNVPMSPALYAQQKMKHYQLNSVPAKEDDDNVTSQQQHHQPQQNQLHQHHNRTDPRSNVECNVPAALPRQSHRGSAPTLPFHTPSPLQQQIHSSTIPKRSSGLRNSLPAINEGSSQSSKNTNSSSDATGKDLQTHSVKHEEAEENHEDDENENSIIEQVDSGNEKPKLEKSTQQDSFYSKQPSYAPSFIPSDSNFMNQDLPALLARNSTGSGGNTSINGLDPDASDLTLEFFQREENKRRSSSQNADISLNSITSLALSENENSPLPSPSLPSCHGSEEDTRSGSGSGLDSRRSSLTRPENLPPKDPEEERKHLKEYEKLLKDAAVAEKKKQQKREEEAKKRAQQAKLDHNTWSNWLAKGQRYSLSSDLKWRGLPEKLRGTIWSLKLGNKDKKTDPPFQMRHNYHHIEKEIIEDSERIWPECAIFGKGRPFHEPLVNVVQQFLGIRKEVPYSFGVTGVAALLLLQLSDIESVRAMLVLLEPGTLTHAVLTGNERLASANYVSFNKVFQAKFPQLSQHFNKVGLTTTELLNPLIAGIFTTVLPTPECATRILDVFIFDGDSFLLRAALGLIRINEAFLYESKQDILLGIQSPRVSTEDALMTAIRDVTRK